MRYKKGFYCREIKKAKDYHSDIYFFDGDRLEFLWPNGSWHPSCYSGFDTITECLKSLHNDYVITFHYLGD